MIFAICAALRLARFNVAIDDPNRPRGRGTSSSHAGAGRRHHGPAADLSRLPRDARVTVLTFVYTLAIAILMVSRVPVFSGKKAGAVCRPKWCCRSS